MITPDYPELFTLYKPDGTEVKVNENSFEAAVKLGWTEKKPTKKQIEANAE